ncbi:MAG: cupredoxin domain-containing protein [Lysobacterales bacterium]
MNPASTFPIALALLLSSSAALAAVHDVMVGNDFFSPNNLTIEVGDTVRWTNNSGMVHDVRADDNSWSSAVSSSFVYERTFNSVAEVLYYCSVHSSPGQNINSNMNGRLNVIASTGSDFAINTALSDAWFDPQTGGQGFFIIVWEDIETVFLSWFTYDTERPPQNVTAHLGEPGHRWLTAQGGFSGDTATLDVYETAGGVFDSPTPAPDPALLVGTINITWTGCNSGVLSYDLPSLNLSADIPIERIVLDNVPACEAAQP